MTAGVRQTIRLTLLPILFALQAADVQALPFTGPTSPYYLDNWQTQRIYVVQGGSVLHSFPWAYGPAIGGENYEGNLAVTNVVTTNGHGNANGPAATAGQYTLSGFPTGVSHSAVQATPGFISEATYDGTSDGRYNYTIQYSSGYVVGQLFTDINVVRSDLQWQNPESIFTVASGTNVDGDYMGITYDPTNNSLWVSGWSESNIRNYSLSGSLLSSFNTGVCCKGALALDHADGTLWTAVGDENGNSNFLQQWSKSGVLLQGGVPAGLPGPYYFAGEFALSTAVEIQEPYTFALLGLGLAALSTIRRRRS